MAPKRITPDLENATLEELETAAKCAPTQRGHNRFRALIALSMGFERERVAKLFGIGEQTVRRWIRAFNESGIDGLVQEPKPGRPRKIRPEQATRCRELLEHPEQAGVQHWTGVKFHGYLRKNLELEVGYSTVIRFLHEQNYRLKVPRPWPDKQDEKQREEFLARLRVLLRDPAVEIWFGDECGFEGDPRPRRRWIQKGQTGKVPRNGSHIRMNACGMVCPRTGEFYALEFTHTDSTTFQAFLDEANKDLTFERQRQILIVDNATWHRPKHLRWGRFEVFYLPPYSPDLNPIERLWLLIKAEWFTDFIARDSQQLIERLDNALLWAINRQTANKKTCSFRS